MKIIAVDDERLALDNFVKLLKKVESEAEIISFIKPADAMEYLSQNRVDIAFLDIEMGELNGIALAKKCKDLCPMVNIIFVTGYSRYMSEAFRLHVSGYLLKPVRERDLRAEIDNLRFPVSHVPTKRVRVQTFGHFEVFVDGRPLNLPRAKSKECLAYLIDRKGARLTVAEIASVLWEDKENDINTQNNAHQVIFTLMKALKDAGIEDIVIKSRREIAIDVSKVDCDYYAVISGDMTQMNAFSGEYMTNYSWAEFTLGELISKKNYEK